jgi:hypothetical protein
MVFSPQISAMRRSFPVSVLLEGAGGCIKTTSSPTKKARKPTGAGRETYPAILFQNAEWQPAQRKTGGGWSQ